MKFRRKQPDPSLGAPDAIDPEQQDVATPDIASAITEDQGRSDGPWDAGEVASGARAATGIDLGGLIVTGKPGLELRLQVDEPTQAVAAALLVGPEGAVELRPFAAPRNGEIWDGIRRQIAAEAARRGGTATETDGVYGKELQLMVPSATPDGPTTPQPSRVVGIQGPRWLLRATFLGKPAVEPDPDGVIESALREVVVVRGSDPMAPGEPLPLVMPASAKPLVPEESAQPDQPPD